MRKILMMLGVIVLSVGCGSIDNDEDGLTSAQEAELGTDPDSADTDDDGVTDDKEVELGTNPTVADSDEDGLNDGDEVSAGTDPTQPDTDLDGFTDSAEVDGDSDPLDYRSYPLEGLKEGHWPNRLAAADGVYGTGWDFGKVMPNIDFLDQYSEAFELYQFYGYVIALDFSAGWCGPCRSLAAGAQALFEELRGEGFIMIHCLTNTNSQGQETDEAFLQSWAEDYSLEFPVAREPVNQKALNYMRDSGLYPQTIPFVVLLDQEMRIDTRYGGSSEEAMKERVMELMSGEASDETDESDEE